MPGECQRLDRRREAAADGQTACRAIVMSGARRFARGRVGAAVAILGVGKTERAVNPEPCGRIKPGPEPRRSRRGDLKQREQHRQREADKPAVS